MDQSVVEPWSVTSLKPLPPMRPYVALGKNCKNKQNMSPKKSVDVNFEDDIQILRVIEAYCSSGKTRSASNSGS
ncbi:hypothetical protein Phum_PHUM148240 [Pediculus humanus corporis]|uniref:Uncharacterized protein n=1 Tax=Pediculus humanus subsp. corporis TaxID=121224 RepID=E0VF05_PEDHC|nr:uncharacterized protein Phum_PHUM148240 [Pediculus humanus corporis]EEB11979.1 hypothetical protein Phum_PHUM148240 [Pediculus humanus corporis]